MTILSIWNEKLCCIFTCSLWLNGINERRHRIMITLLFIIVIVTAFVIVIVIYDFVSRSRRWICQNKFSIHEQPTYFNGKLLIITVSCIMLLSLFSRGFLHPHYCLLILSKCIHSMRGYIRVYYSLKCHEPCFSLSKFNLL